MSMMQVISVLSEGNPGALTVLTRMIAEGATIDPQSALKRLSGPLALDEYGIYGPRIWMLYKDVCGENLATTLAMLRAVQLGFLPKSLLDAVIDTPPGAPVVEQLVAQLNEFLPEFARNADTPAKNTSPTDDSARYTAYLRELQALNAKHGLCAVPTYGGEVFAHDPMYITGYDEDWQKFFARSVRPEPQDPPEDA